MTPVEVVQRCLAAIERRDKAGFMACASPELRLDVGQYSESSGEQPWSDAWDNTLRAFPDARFTIVNSIGGGPHECAVEYEFTGTHTGPGLSYPELGLENIAPTGKKITYRFCTLNRVENDRLVIVNFFGVLDGQVQALDVVRTALGRESP